MKIHKLRKKDFYDLGYMYKRLNCSVFPYCAFVSPKTYKTMEKKITAEFKKKYNYLNKKSLDAAVGLHMLNLGPVVLKGLPDNVVLIDESTVEEHKEHFREINNKR